VTSEGFERFAAEGVIDIQAVDVPSGPVKLADAAATRDRTTIDVEVQQLPDGDG